MTTFMYRKFAMKRLTTLLFTKEVFIHSFSLISEFCTAFIFLFCVCIVCLQSSILNSPLYFLLTNHSAICLHLTLAKRLESSGGYMFKHNSF